MRERRKLTLIARQAMMAQIARRDALTALAEAIDEESRRTSLANRSRMLMREYGANSGVTDASDLRAQATFRQSLQTVVEQADKARLDAHDQAEWQMAALAKAEARASRIDDHHGSAKRALDAALERREQAHSSQMARKLQNHDSEAEAHRPAHRTGN